MPEQEQAEGCHEVARHHLVVVRVVSAVQHVAVPRADGTVEEQEAAVPEPRVAARMQVHVLRSHLTHVRVPGRRAARTAGQQDHERE